jgi:hypothetical protein
MADAQSYLFVPFIDSFIVAIAFISYQVEQRSHFMGREVRIVIAFVVFLSQKIAMSIIDRTRK